MSLWLPTDVSGSHVLLCRLPHVGQNLWFYLDCVDDVRGLCESLHPRGVRESVLKDELQKNMDAIMKSVSSISARYVKSYNCPCYVSLAFMSTNFSSRLNAANGSYWFIVHMVNLVSELVICEQMSVVM